jgi:transposase-like protein
MKRKKFSSEVKLDIVLTYLSGNKSVASICAEYAISRTVLHEWLNLLKARHKWIFCHKKQLDGLSRAHQVVQRLREENTRLRERLGEMDYGDE